MPSRLEQEHTLPFCNSPALVADMGSRVAVLVTHPWGPLGGSMHNNVVAAAVLYFQRLGITTMRFNFVGWQIGRGNRQVRQVVEAANYVLSGAFQQKRHSHHGDPTDKSDDKKKSPSDFPPPPSYVLLVGYSYGSLISASASASIPRCVGVVSIAPPWGVKHWLLCFNSNYHMNQARARTSLPRLLILGSRDNFTSEDVFFNVVQTFDAESTTGAILKDADHFFARRERDLMTVVGQWIMGTYVELGGDLKRLRHAELVSYALVVKGEEESGTVAASFLNDCAVFDSSCRY